MKTIFRQLLFCAMTCLGVVSSADNDKAFNNNYAEAESLRYYSDNERWPTNLVDLSSFINAKYENRKNKPQFSPEDYRSIGFTNLPDGNLQLTLTAQSGEVQNRVCERPPTTALKVIQQDGYLIVQDGSSFYYFDNEKTFISGPVNSWCGRGILGSYDSIAPWSFTAEGTMMYFNRPGGNRTQYKMKMEVNSVKRDSEPFDFKNLIFFVGYQKGKHPFPTNPVSHQAYFVFDYLVPTENQQGGVTNANMRR